mmetsp:Transcript_26617/g.77473  ORF Transcript_26617/g.77473 Transcript_26617/m.77473 type:complete len:158 (-) Transcript_26617:220-693(-)
MQTPGRGSYRAIPLGTPGSDIAEEDDVVKRSYRLWHKDSNSVEPGLAPLGQAYSTGVISKLEFEHRSMLIEHFAKFRQPGSPFRYEDPQHRRRRRRRYGEAEEEHWTLHERCYQSALAATVVCLRVLWLPCDCLLRITVTGLRKCSEALGSRSSDDL